VDARPKVAEELTRVLPGAVYCARSPWGWGAGLYGLLAESIVWSRQLWQYSHFLSIDYDTLFIGSGVDEVLLNQITDLSIGLIGEYTVRNTHWFEIFNRDKVRIQEKLGPIPRSYREGEGIQGGVMVLTNTLLLEMERRGMLSPPFSTAKTFTGIADDHLLPLFCRMCGLEIAQIGETVYAKWQLDRDPVGLEKKGVKVFHPTKLRPDCRDRNAELRIRNYFRGLRGREKLV
jgi:hypothetical protein